MGVLFIIYTAGLCLELDSDVHEFYLEGYGAFEAVFSECVGGYWSIIIHIDENEWHDCDWVLEDDESEEILDVQLVRDENLG